MSHNDSRGIVIAIASFRSELTEPICSAVRKVFHEKKRRVIDPIREWGHQGTYDLSGFPKRAQKTCQKRGIKQGLSEEVGRALYTSLVLSEICKPHFKDEGVWLVTETPLVHWLRLIEAEALPESKADKVVERYQRWVGQNIPDLLIVAGTSVLRARSKAALLDVIRGDRPWAHMIDGVDVGRPAIDRETLERNAHAAVNTLLYRLNLQPSYCATTTAVAMQA